MNSAFEVLIVQPQSHVFSLHFFSFFCLLWSIIFFQTNQQKQSNIKTGVACWKNNFQRVGRALGYYVFTLVCPLEGNVPGYWWIDSQLKVMTDWVLELPWRNGFEASFIWHIRLFFQSGAVHVLRNFEKTSNMPKIWQQMKKSLVDFALKNNSSADFR